VGWNGVRHPEAVAEIVQRGAFFDTPGLEKPKRDGRPPPGVRHLALSVDSLETLSAWKVRLESHGLQVTGPVDHDGVWSSIFVSNFSGLVLAVSFRHHVPGRTRVDLQDLHQRVTRTGIRRAL
jgi:hypothetical protein